MAWQKSVMTFPWLRNRIFYVTAARVKIHLIHHHQGIFTHLISRGKQLPKPGRCLGPYLFLQGMLGGSRGWPRKEFERSRNPVRKQRPSQLAQSRQQQTEHQAHAGERHLWIHSNQKMLHHTWGPPGRTTNSKDRKAQASENACCGLLSLCVPSCAALLKWGAFPESGSIYLGHRWNTHSPWVIPGRVRARHWVLSIDIFKITFKVFVFRQLSLWPKCI